MSGRYVAIEGVDGAGKTTVARHVVAALVTDGLDARFVREPGGTPTGEAIRRVLLDRGGVVAPWAEALLFAAGRSHLAAEVVGPALEAGAIVVSDRTVYSSLAYQGGARGLGIETVRAVNEAGLQGVWPDLVVLLDMEPAAALAREDTAD
ncbi:MAG TPA: dTMP kinase, partial [Acidimicrobiia bacterium]|nr:dTMP kinase [Acidimicrobiia bacterium]